MATLSVPSQYSTLTAALAAANAGDTISVDPSYGRTTGPGASGNEYITLPAKPTTSNSYITIQSSAIANLPAGTRVSPNSTQFMPRIWGNPNTSTNFDGSSIVLAYSGNSTTSFSPVAYYKLIGLEIATHNSAGGNGHSIVRIAGVMGSDGFPNSSCSSTALNQLSHDIILDRCYIHGQDNDQIQVGVQGSCGALTITECYISNIKIDGSESHGFFTTDGNGPFNINNTYLEAATQNFFSGGQPDRLLDFVGPTANPTGSITNCTVAKDPRLNQAAAAALGLTYLPPPNSWVFKNLIEFKKGDTWKIDRNIIQYGFSQAQDGEVIVFNFTEYNAKNSARCQHIHITNNVCDTVGPLMTLNYEVQGQAAGGVCRDSNNNPTNCPLNASQLFTDIILQNNHVTNWASRYDTIFGASGGQSLIRFGTGTYQATFIIDHNTCLIDPNVSFQSGASFIFDSNYNANNAGSFISAPTLTNSLLTNNLSYESNAGWQMILNGQTAQGTDNASVITQWSNSTFIVKGNSIAGNSSGQNWVTSVFPNGNFAGPATGPSGLIQALALVPTTRTFKGAGRNGADITLTLYSAGASTPGKGQAYINVGAGTTSFADPGCDLSALPGGTTNPAATTTTIANSPITLAQGAAATPPCTGTNVLVLVNVTASGGTPTGNVMLYLNPGPSQTAYGPVALTNGQATFCITQPAVGTYNLGATFTDPLGTWLTSSGTGSLTITGPKPAPAITITPTPTAYPNNWPITVNAAPASGQTAIPSGNVTLSIDGTAYAPLTLNTDGNAFFRIPGIGGGSHALSVFYGGDSNYASTTQNATGTITAAPDQMTVNVTTPIQFGQNATVTVSVSNQPPADTTITINSTLTYQAMTGFGAQYSILGVGTAAFGTKDASLSQLSHIAGLLFGQLKVNILAGQNLHEMQGSPPTNAALYSGTPTYHQDSNPTDTNANFASVPSKTGLYPSLSSFANWFTGYTDYDWNHWLNAATDLAGSPTPKQLLGSNLYWFGCSESHPLNIRYEDRWAGDLRDNTNLSGHYPSGVGANGQQKFIYCIARQVLAQIRYMELAFGYVPPWVQLGAEAISGLRTLQNVNNADTYSTGNMQEVVDLVQKICDTIRTAGYATKVVICTEDACGPNQETPSSLSLAQFVLPKLTAQALQNVGAIGYHQNPYGSTYCVLGGSPVSILATSGSGNPFPAEVNDRQTLAALAKQYGLQVWMVAMSHGNVENSSSGFVLTSFDGTSFDTLRGRAVDIHDQILYANASAYMLQGMYWSTNGAASPPDPVTGVNGDSLTTLAQYNGADLLVLGDIPSNTWIITMGGYAMGHYSRWLLTGDVRIDAQSTNALVQVTAFKRTSPATAIVVLINNDTASHTVALNLLGINWTGTITGEQSTAGNIYIGITAPGSGATATVTLPGRSVTSLAGPAQ